MRRRDHADRRSELTRVRHRQIDRPGADLLGPGLRLPMQKNAGLRPAPDLDLAPREMNTRAERLTDRLFGRESAGVVLRGVRLRVAVGDLCCHEAALPDAGVPVERQPDPLDLD